MAIDLIVWWYGAGLEKLFERIRLLLAKTYDLFSMDLLVRTLFAPFRQIDVGTVSGSLDVMLHRAFDQLFSRFVGFMIRSATIAVGLVVLTLVAIGCLLWLVAWLMSPLLPLIGIGMAAMGVGR